MKSKTKIEKQLRRKTNPEIVEAIIKSKKNNNWLKVSELMATPRRMRVVMNLDKINSEAKDGEIILVPGKVLSKGDIDKKIKIVSLDISDSALEKLKKSKTDYSNVLDEIKKNPEGKKIRILTGR